MLIVFKLMSHGNELHYNQRSGWLRAAVLGANDGIISISSLIIGFASANADQSSILLAGIAGLVAGAISMASGEYVSVSSQADIENADLERERQALEKHHELELEELTKIYIDRGLDRELASAVAHKLTEHDALETHARDELGISIHNRARPLQAAFTSAISFAIGAIPPVFLAMFFPSDKIVSIVAVSTLFLLALLGSVSAKAGGSPILKAIFRVTFWGSFAMAITSVIGDIFGAVAI